MAHWVAIDENNGYWAEDPVYNVPWMTGSGSEDGGYSRLSGIYNHNGQWVYAGMNAPTDDPGGYNQVLTTTSALSTDANIGKYVQDAILPGRGRFVNTTGRTREQGATGNDWEWIPEKTITQYMQENPGTDPNMYSVLYGRGGHTSDPFGSNVYGSNDMALQNAGLIQDIPKPKGGDWWNQIEGWAVPVIAGLMTAGMAAPALAGVAGITAGTAATTGQLAMAGALTGATAGGVGSLVRAPENINLLDTVKSIGTGAVTGGAGGAAAGVLAPQIASGVTSLTGVTSPVANAIAAPITAGTTALGIGAIRSGLTGQAFDPVSILPGVVGASVSAGTNLLSNPGITATPTTSDSAVSIDQANAGDGAATTTFDSTPTSIPVTTTDAKPDLTGFGSGEPTVNTSGFNVTSPDNLLGATQQPATPPPTGQDPNWVPNDWVADYPSNTLNDTLASVPPTNATSNTLGGNMLDEFGNPIVTYDQQYDVNGDYIGPGSEPLPGTSVTYDPNTGDWTDRFGNPYAQNSNFNWGSAAGTAGNFLTRLLMGGGGKTGGGAAGTPGSGGEGSSGLAPILAAYLLSQSGGSSGGLQTQQASKFTPEQQALLQDLIAKQRTQAALGETNNINGVTAEEQAYLAKLKGYDATGKTYADSLTPQGIGADQAMAWARAQNKATQDAYVNPYNDQLMQQLMKENFTSNVLPTWDESTAPRLRDEYSGPGYWGTARADALGRSLNDVTRAYGTKSAEARGSVAQLGMQASDANQTRGQNANYGTSGNLAMLSPQAKTQALNTVFQSSVPMAGEAAKQSNYIQQKPFSLTSDPNFQTGLSLLGMQPVDTIAGMKPATPNFLQQIAPVLGTVGATNMNQTGNLLGTTGDATAKWLKDLFA